MSEPLVPESKTNISDNMTHKNTRNQEANLIDTQSTSNSNGDGIDGPVSPKEQRLEDIKNQCSKLISELDSQENPEAIVKRHISQLKQYHELKDIALGLVTMIADQRKLRTTDILEEMRLEIGND